jgi:N,N'-diacetyllegionaminate synthase
MIIGRHDTVRDGTYIIAEAGVNHNGSLELAKKLVDAALAAGATAVKFQMFRTDLLVAPTFREQHAMLKKYELTAEQFAELKRYCDKSGISFLATPFDPASAEQLRRFEPDAYKIGSGDLTCHALLSQVARYKKPVLLSTGMSGLGDIEAALACLEDGGAEVALLHCTSAYPAPFDSVNLRAIDTLRSAFGKEVGYSDHTPGIEISLAAVALGCRIIEKHFTLDRNMEGPDHQASLEPDELKRLVESVRHIERAMGSKRKRMSDAETETKKKARRGIYLARDMSAGDVVSEQDLLYLRPVQELEASDYRKVVGRRLNRDKRKYEPLSFNELD